MLSEERIYELKIEEDDDVSGIDSISLVDSPAIEVEWRAFRKEEDTCGHKHQFSEDDQKYVNHLMTNSEDEETLLNDGWVIDTIEIMTGKENFVQTDPNGPSIEDEKEYKVRYKYILNPDISGPAIIPTSRDFCRELIAQNKVFRVEDIEAAVNDFGQSPLVYRGSWNCRHVWARIKYRNDATIINKASVNKGKTTVAGFPNDIIPDVRVMGYDEPSTITSVVKKAVKDGTAAPSTPKNLGLRTEKFAGEKISIDYDDTLSTDRGKTLAKRLLSEGKDLHIVTRRQESDLGPVYKVAEDLGIPKDKVHATNGKLKWETIKRLGITKHIDNNENELKAIKDNLPDVQTEKFGYDVSTIVGYQDPGLKKKKKVIEKPVAFDSYFESFSTEKTKQQFVSVDDEKRIVIGPAMIPDQKIFRRDEKTGENYYVYFSSDTIRMIAEKYMKNQYTRNNDLMHDGKAVSDIYVIESWIKEDEEDKSSKYGYGDLPVGSWFVSMKIPKTPEGDKVWEKVKNKELNGFSVSGYFEEVAKFSREEVFLNKVINILKQVKD